MEANLKNYNLGEDIPDPTESVYSARLESERPGFLGSRFGSRHFNHYLVVRNNSSGRELKKKIGFDSHSVPEATSGVVYNCSELVEGFFNEEGIKLVMDVPSGLVKSLITRREKTRRKISIPRGEFPN